MSTFMTFMTATKVN